MSNNDNNKVNEPLGQYEQPLSFEKVWLMFQEAVFPTHVGKGRVGVVASRASATVHPPKPEVLEGWLSVRLKQNKDKS